MDRLLRDECPKAITEKVTDFGGRNLYGWPTWRVCLAQLRQKIANGPFNETKPGENPLEIEGWKRLIDQYGAPVMEQILDKSSGRVIDERQRMFMQMALRQMSCTTNYEKGRWIPLYPQKFGWILERWFPPAIFGGPRDEWENTLAADGLTRIHGDYPSQGGYWMIDGPRPELWEVSDLEVAIRTYEHMMDDLPDRRNPSAFAAYMTVQMKAIRDAEEKQWRDYEALVLQFFQSEIEPVFNGLSLEASRIRQQAANQIGITSHQGAGQ